MKEMKGSLKVVEVKYTGKNKEPRLITFDNPITILNGASNTGKSFIIETIDFMLGSEEIDQIEQSKGYEEISMKINLENKPFTMYREFNSLQYSIYNGYIDTKDEACFFAYYKVGKETKKIKNINDFFLGELSLTDTEVSANLYAEKNRLTVRLLSRIVISKEEKIITKDSPIVAGDTSENSKNRNVFKFLLTGEDDKNVETIVREKEFKSEIKGKITILDDVIKDLVSNLTFDKESLDSLEKREENLENKISNLTKNILEIEKGLSIIIKERKNVANSLTKYNERLNTVIVNYKNFEYLHNIYDADIQRLKSQEEASFLLSSGHKGTCSVCGSESEQICNDLENINLLSKASIAEINKIEQKKDELIKTMKSLESQKDELINKVSSLNYVLQELDLESKKRTPSFIEEDKTIANLRFEKELVSKDIYLHRQIKKLEQRIKSSEKEKAPKKHDSKEFYPTEVMIKSFCTEYSKILKQIDFPGGDKVTFDYKNYDVIINDNPRHLNGKGVRAILNSVFKIALLQHCRLKGLFHPGLIILDSPLLTYRDPLTSKYGELEKDEEKLSKTKLSYKFLSYLHTIKDLGQFIIIENIDLPSGLSKEITIETFYGKNEEDKRVALF